MYLLVQHEIQVAIISLYLSSSLWYHKTNLTCIPKVGNISTVSIKHLLLKQASIGSGPTKSLRSERNPIQELRDGVRETFEAVVGTMNGASTQMFRTIEERIQAITNGAATDDDDDAEESEELDHDKEEEAKLLELESEASTDPNKKDEHYLDVDDDDDVVAANLKDGNSLLTFENKGLKDSTSVADDDGLDNLVDMLDDGKDSTRIQFPPKVSFFSLLSSNSHYIHIHTSFLQAYNFPY